MSKDYKLYNRYVATNTGSVSGYVKNMTETSGSGYLSSLDTIVYETEEMSFLEIEKIFKEKYPLHYIHLRKKFEKKIKKLLKAYEESAI